MNTYTSERGDSTLPAVWQTPASEVEQKEPQRPAGAGLVLLWIAAYMLAGVASWGLSSAVFALIIPVLQRGAFSALSWQWQAASMLISLVGGAIIGVSQWLVLRRYVAGIAWWTWSAATMGGFLLAYPFDFALTFAAPFLLGTFLFDTGIPGTLLSAVAGQLIGALIRGLFGGGLQWLVLQRHLRGAGVWVLAVMGSGILSQLIASVPILTLQSDRPALDMKLYSILSFLVGTPIIASITGFTLLWLVNHTRRSNWTYEAS